MKKLALLAVLLSASASLFAQTVVFNNTASTAYRLTTNNGAGLMSGASGYRIGLYAGPSGSAETALSLVGLATNAPLAGYFSGGNPFFLPSPYAAGDTVAFQVRGWQFSGGLDYASAVAAGVGNGKSTLGSVTLGGGTVLAGTLFGTGAGQIGSFDIASAIVPEPSSIALGLLGLGAIALFRRRK